MIHPIYKKMIGFCKFTLRSPEIDAIALLKGNKANIPLLDGKM
jgi:hypothetical protein